MYQLSLQEYHLDNQSLQEIYMDPLSLQEYHLKNLSPQDIHSPKKNPLMNPYTNKTLKSLKGNYKENNLLNEVISWFGDKKKSSHRSF